MSESSLMVTLPDGKKRGPFTAELLEDLWESGGLPEDSKVLIEGDSVILADAVALIQEKAGKVRKRASPSLRARLGCTVAETPSAISAALVNKS